ncbi:MAG: hypothetical protein HYV28_09425 [Ignavibacteriales bacterium]|nr:hypothetical protein [Ignavibacteriales bacterium]
MYYIVALFAAIIVWLLYEYRLRKPDQLVLTESNGVINENKSRFYPRHFCLALPNTTFGTQVVIETAAKGNIDIKVKLAYTVAASKTHIPALIKVGGWNENAVIKSARELDTIIHRIVKEYVENFKIEELTSEKIYNYLRPKLDVIEERLGLELISITVQSYDAIDSKISEALKKQESARIFEQTEKLNQQARISAAKARLQADEEIALMENELELKRLELKKSELEQESIMALKRIEDELQRKKLQLAYDDDELTLLKKSPELLMLTPQAARLAEASQSMKNARTIVSLSPGDFAQGADLIGLFQKFLESAMSNYTKGNVEKP